MNLKIRITKKSYLSNNINILFNHRVQQKKIKLCVSLNTQPLSFVASNWIGPTCDGYEKTLTGYDINFDRRHGGDGHLFQNIFNPFLVKRRAPSVFRGEDIAKRSQY